MATSAQRWFWLPWWLVFGLAQALLGQTHPTHVVLAYSASWRDAQSPPQYFNYAAVTHIARSFCQPHADGSVTVPDGFFNSQLESAARDAGVKLLISLGGEAEDASRWVKLASNPDSLAKFCTQMQSLLNDHHYDGIDIDWEPAPLTDTDAAAYATLITTIRAKMPDIVLTTALPASDYWIGHMQWDKVMPCFDYINVMTYDYAGLWGGIAGHGSNLFPPTSYPPQPEYSADEGMRNLLEKHYLPPQKLLMGMTFWAYRFATPKIGDKFPANKAGCEENIPYAAVLGLLRGGAYRSLWDEGAKMPYLQRIEGASTISYEDPESIRRKCEYAKARHLAGVMIWHIGADQDGDQAPLLDAVAQSFGVPAMIQPRAALENALHPMGQPPPHPNAQQIDPTTLDLATLHARYVELMNFETMKMDRAWRGDAAAGPMP